MKYENKNNGIIGEVVKENLKFKTVTLRLDNGIEKDYSIATIKRHWKEIPSNPVEEITTEEEAPVVDAEVTSVETDQNDPDTCEDGRTYAEIGKEIAEQAKAKAKEAKKSKKKAAKKAGDKPAKAPAEDVMKDSVEWVKSLVSNTFGDEVFVPNAHKVLTFKVEGHMYCRFSFSSKKMTLAVKSAAMSEGSRTPDIQINHMFNYGYVYNVLSDEDKIEIESILSDARSYRIEKSKSSKKTKKEE